MPYVEQERGYGNGDLRIGSPIDLDDDIYCLSYIVQMKNSHLVKFLDFDTGVIFEAEEREKLLALDVNSSKFLANLQEYEDDAIACKASLSERRHEVMQYGKREITYHEFI